MKKTWALRYKIGNNYTVSHLMDYTGPHIVRDTSEISTPISTLMLLVANLANTK